MAGMIGGGAMPGDTSMGPQRRFGPAPGMQQPIQSPFGPPNPWQAGPYQAQNGYLGGGMMSGQCPPWMPNCQGGASGMLGGSGGAGLNIGNSRGGLAASASTSSEYIAPPSTGTTIGYSDAALKGSVEPLEDGLELVNRLSPVRFNWVGSDAEITGMIAQQVEEVLPGAVIDMAGGYRGIDGLAVIGALVGAVQELTARLEALEKA